MSKCCLNSSQLGVLNGSLGCPFQCPTMLSEKNLCLISNLNLFDTSSGHSLKSYHWSPERRHQCLPHCLLSKRSCKQIRGLVSSVSSSLCCRLKYLTLFLYSFPSRPFTVFLALLWALFGSLISLHCGIQNFPQHSR